MNLTKMTGAVRGRSAWAIILASFFQGGGCETLPDGTDPSKKALADPELKVSGSEFVVPPVEKPVEARAEMEESLRGIAPWELVDPEGMVPEETERAENIYKRWLRGTRGRSKIYQYTNRDVDTGRFGSWGLEKSCGQSAAATALNAAGIDCHVNDVYDRYRPDAMFGVWGTTPARVCAAIRGFGGRIYGVRGVESLKRWIGYGYPVVVLLELTDIAGPEGWPDGYVRGTDSEEHKKMRFQMHYVVVFAYDNERVWMTNWPGNWCSWSNFEKGWNGGLLGTVGMRNLGLLVWK